MSMLAGLVTALRGGAIEVIDLTAPLSEDTPIIALPPERGQPWRFSREVISHYDLAGPTVYWNNIKLSEHTGTHFDAPVHWLSGKDLIDVSSVPPGQLIGPAAVLDLAEEVDQDPGQFVIEGRVFGVFHGARARPKALDGFVVPEAAVFRNQIGIEHVVRHNAARRPEDAPQLMADALEQPIWKPKMGDATPAEIRFDLLGQNRLVRAGE